ncbi:helix-turn-helix domain-containing protein [Paenibacillus sp. Marseille-Q4541]|uniref:helix-turn-helix domain-containing protein n=1 Tax=Paenibacillus sp. Marseille-Q4541 TaxID=2831522 RepID=UPI001BA4C747|nr:helix-turn-helix domain-containing protein [Paenibacillus sp. Marseille-Q4541]
MIKTETAYRRAKEKLKDHKAYIVNEKLRFQSMGLSKEQTSHAIQPLLAFKDELAEEIHNYEMIKQGTFFPVQNIMELGKNLIAHRIYLNLSQAELAKRLGVSEAQVSRDERNEYEGATTEKIQSVMNALGLKTTIHIEMAVG